MQQQKTSFPGALEVFAFGLALFSKTKQFQKIINILLKYSLKSVYSNILLMGFYFFLR